MVVWIIAVSLAGIFFLRGEAIVLSVFSGPLSHGAYGFVRPIIGVVAFCAEYFMPLAILALTYNLRNCGFRSCRGLSRAEGEGQFGPCRGPSERSDAELLIV